MTEIIEFPVPDSNLREARAPARQKQPAPLFEPEGRPPLARHQDELKLAARRKLPRAIFDYVEGGAYAEITLRANRADFDALRIRQGVLRTSGERRQATTIAGQEARLPVALGPTGFAGLIRPGGEIMAARGAARCGVPYCLSTFSTCSMEQLAGAVTAPFWFQLYLFKDCGVNAALIERAETAGCPALVLTLDTAVQGRRHRDIDNGLVVPLKVRTKLFLQALLKPRWGIGWLTSEHTMGNLAMFVPGRAELADVSLWTERNYKGALTPDDVAFVRERWPHKLILKGILDAEDAGLAVKLGADGIIVSNHGGRQLDGAVTTVKAFPAVRDAVQGDVELFIDSGIRSGLDVLKALGLGAKACFLGRAYLYGLAAYGESGVCTALRLMAEELDAGMALAGVEDVNDLPSGLTIVGD